MKSSGGMAEEPASMNSHEKNAPRRGDHWAADVILLEGDRKQGRSRLALTEKSNPSRAGSRGIKALHQRAIKKAPIPPSSGPAGKSTGGRL